jgi:hypothetical protein
MGAQGPGWLYSLYGIRQRYRLLREPLYGETHTTVQDASPCQSFISGYPFYLL